LWAAMTEAGVEALHRASQAGPALRADLYAGMGYDPLTRTFDRHSPMLTAALPKLHTLAAGSLYRHGWGWLDAELLVERHFVPALEAAFDPALLQPTADIAALFAALSEAGVKLAVVTSDDRGPTLATLARLGVAEWVAFVAAADDPYPHKPAPDGLWAACHALDVEPSAAVYVGDSTTDMLAAQRAGIGLRVAVCTGLMDAATLAPHAHVVLPSVGEIRVA
jgi:phosphoglycolate phosphatase